MPLMRHGPPNSPSAIDDDYDRSFSGSTGFTGFISPRTAVQETAFHHTNEDDTTPLHEKCQVRSTLVDMQERRQSEVTDPHTQARSLSMANHQRPPSARTRRSSGKGLYDNEKYFGGSMRHHSRLDSVTSREAVAAEEGRTKTMRLLKKDLGALVNFMTLTPFASILIALHAFLATLAIIIISPFNLCISTRPTISTQLRHVLLPAQNLHYKCAWSSARATKANVYRSWPGSVHTDISDAELGTPVHTADSPSVALILVVLLLSPLLAVPMAFAAVVVALWWIMSAITADEVADGLEGRKTKREGYGGFDEGQRLARKLRVWWVGWLSGDKLR